MQFTLIAIQANGQQLVLGQDLQEHSVELMVRGAVASSSASQAHPDTKYRSFLACGTTTNATIVLRYNARGEVVQRSAGLV